MSGYGRAFTVGDIFTETFAIFAANWRIVLAYAAIVALAGSAFEAMAAPVAQGSAAVLRREIVTNIPVMIVGNIAGYVLSWQLLENLGLATAPRSVGLFFLNLLAGLIMGVCVAFGVVLLVLPGLILMARWSVATSLIVGRGARLVEALGESWALTKSRQWTIVGFYCLFFLVFFAVLTPLTAVISAAGLATDNVGPTGVALGFLKGLLQYLLSGVSFCAAAALFELVLEYSGSEEEVFA